MTGVVIRQTAIEVEGGTVRGYLAAYDDKQAEGLSREQALRGLIDEVAQDTDRRPRRCDNPGCYEDAAGITRERLELDEVWEFCSIGCAKRWHDLDWERVIA